MRCYAELKCRFWMCANECMWTSVKLRSHALKFKGNGPLDPLSALQCRKLGVDIFFWSSWGSNTSSLEIMRERHAWPALINPTWSKKDTHASSCGSRTITQTHVSSNASSHDSNTQYPFSSSWVNECWSCVPLTHIFKKTCLWTPTRSEKDIHT